MKNNNDDNLFALRVEDAIIVNNKDFKRIMEENSALTKELYFYKKKYDVINSNETRNISLEEEEEIILDELSIDETKRILQNELIKTKNKIIISQLIYNLHECDSYEDLFRDNIPALQTRFNGIQISIDNFNNKDNDSESESS